MCHDLLFFYISLFFKHYACNVNDTQTYLQQIGLALDQCGQKLKELALFCEEKCDSLITDAAERASYADRWKIWDFYRKKNGNEKEGVSWKK